VQAAVGEIDILFLGMECEGAPMSWIYGSMFTMPLVPMGQEPWLNHVMALKYTDASPQIVESNKLLEFCRGRGIPAERPFCQKEILL
jgi:hypothetical protein